MCENIRIQVSPRESGDGAGFMCEQPQTTQEAFAALKKYFGLEPKQPDLVFAIDSGRRVESKTKFAEPRGVEAALFRIMVLGDDGTVAPEERLVIVKDDGGDKSRWLVGPNGAISFNANNVDVNVTEFSVRINNPLPCRRLV